MAIVEILNKIEDVKYPPIDLKQSDLLNIIWKQFDPISVKNTEQEKLPDDVAGIFRIRRNPNEISEEAKSGIIQVFCGSKRCDIRVTCSPGEILYIGKSTKIKERVAQIFSLDENSNSVARKLVAIFKEPHNQPEAKDMTPQLLKEIKSRIMFEYLLEPHPILREFLKSYAVSIDRPCLNIGLEH